jgi:hypothetical protein
MICKFWNVTIFSLTLPFYLFCRWYYNTSMHFRIIWKIVLSPIQSWSFRSLSLLFSFWSKVPLGLLESISRLLSWFSFSFLGRWGVYWDVMEVVFCSFWSVGWVCFGGGFVGGEFWGGARFCRSLHFLVTPLHLNLYLFSWKLLHSIPNPTYLILITHP